MWFIFPQLKKFDFFRKNRLLPVDKAAAIIARGLARNKPRITFPWQMVLITRLAINLPGFLADRLNKPYGVKPLEED